MWGNPMRVPSKASLICHNCEPLYGLGVDMPIAVCSLQSYMYAVGLHVCSWSVFHGDCG